MRAALRTLAACAAAGVCALAWWACGGEPAADEAPVLSEEHPWSVQLHLPKIRIDGKVECEIVSKAPFAIYANISK